MRLISLFSLSCVQDCANMSQTPASVQEMKDENTLPSKVDVVVYGTGFVESLLAG